MSGFKSQIHYLLFASKLVSRRNYGYYAVKMKKDVAHSKQELCKSQSLLLAETLLLFFFCDLVLFYKIQAVNFPNLM